MTIYTKRKATSGDITVCSERQWKNTMTYWFNIWHGGTWVKFDIRTQGNGTYTARSGPGPGEHYETFLQSELQRAANYIAEVGYKP